MPIYPLKCQACGADQGEVFHHMAQAHPVCTACGGATETDPSRLNVKTEPVFAGSKRLSLRLAFHPDEVNEARRLYPSMDCDDEGRVYFNSRGHERTVMREINSVRSRVKEAMAEAPGVVNEVALDVG